MLDVRHALAGRKEQLWFDRLFERMVPTAATRLARELASLAWISWQRLGAIRVEALQSIGPPAKVARPLLDWLAPRRPHLPRFVATLR